MRNFAFSLSLVALCAACARQEVKTPTRVLDRPSDLALFCVDFEFGDYPKREAFPSPGAFLGAACSFATDQAPRPRLQPQDACGPNGRKALQEVVLAPLREAARQVGLNPDYPCCPAGEAACSVEVPVRVRRKLEALVTNTGRGEVAVVDTQALVSGLNTVGDIQNLHSGKPGFGFLPVGRLPDHVRSGAVRLSDKGRTEWAVTTNAGTCDLSVIDLGAVVDLLAVPQDCGAASCPRQLTPWVGPDERNKTPIASRPGWVEVAPWRTVSGADEVPHALVAYPSCGLLADVDLGSGQITEALTFGANGAPQVLSGAALQGLRCPAECGGSTGPLRPDVAPSPGAVAPRPSSVAVDMEVDPASGALVRGQLLVADAASAALTIVPFSLQGGARLKAPRTLSLDFSGLAGTQGARGVDVIRVAPRGAAGRFAYAVARDNTVRVVDLDREVECETNPDPRHLQKLAQSGEARVLPDDPPLLYQNLRRFSCFPVGKTPRNPQVLSPGISLPGGGLPRDVAPVRIDISCDPADPDCAYSKDAAYSAWLPASPGLWVGDFMWILGSNGIVQAVQVADYCPLPSFRACFPEQAAARRVALLQTRSVGRPSPERVGLPALPQASTMTPLDRMGNVRRAVNARLSENDQGPRVDTDGQGRPIWAVSAPGLPEISVFTDDLREPMSPRRRLSLPAPAEYFYLPTDPVCDVALAEPARERGADPQNGEFPANSSAQFPIYRPKTIAGFPDPLGVVTEVWSLDWEGVLPGLTRVAGRLRGDGTLVDAGGLYCGRGVEPGDKVWLPGCTQDAECPSAACVREPTQGSAAGICLPNQQAGARCRVETERLTMDVMVPEQQRETNWAVTWQRRYRVLKAEQGVQGGGVDTVDRLALGEVAEPEFSIEGESCTNVGQQCPDSAAVHVPLRGTRCDAQMRCAVGTCNLQTQVCETVKPTFCHVTGKDQAGQLTRRCVVECDDSRGCGTGFVCAHSRFDVEERADRDIGKVRPRCLRAPVLQEGVPRWNGASWQPATQAEVGNMLAACFPEALTYQVRGGDAFVVNGTQSGAPVLVKVDQGECKRPDPVADKDIFGAARLRQPRLSLGPKEVGAGPLCPPRAQWISHRLGPPPKEALEAPSCRDLRARGYATLPSNNAQLGVVPASAQSDPWIEAEGELLSSLPLEGTRNACVLSGAEEDPARPVDAACPDGTKPPCARRIHYENQTLNVVLRLPQRLPEETAECGLRQQMSCTPSKPEWIVPPPGYAVRFRVEGGFRSYGLPAVVSAGQQAQGLRSATVAPDGAVFLVDEGRTGAAAGLRGQLLRLYRAGVDPNFLVR